MCEYVCLSLCPTLDKAIILMLFAYMVTLVGVVVTAFKHFDDQRLYLLTTSNTLHPSLPPTLSFPPPPPSVLYFQ